MGAGAGITVSEEGSGGRRRGGEKRREGRDGGGERWGEGRDGPSCGLNVHQATIHHPRLWTSQVPATTNGECRLLLLGSWGGCPVL